MLGEARQGGGAVRTDQLAFSRLRRRVGRLVSSNYDISNRCNLQCEGCLFFAGDDYKKYDVENDLALWDRFFESEAARGVNFGYFAGAEPSLEQARLAAAYRHIDKGVIFSNGLVHISPEIGYRIHISLWGDEAASTELRGASNAKALRNYAGDSRAAFVFTISAQNIDTIGAATRAVADAGSTISFSLFSPTTKYLSLAELDAADAKYFRKAGDSDQTMMLTAEDMRRAWDEIEKARALHPQTVIYSAYYHDWITQPDGIYDLDAETGIARNCGSILTEHHRHYNVDLSATEAKCCSPNLDCRNCRAYAMGYATFLKTHVSPRMRDAQAPGWLDVWETWARLFLPEDEAAAEAPAPGYPVVAAA